jgi:hypothetical protein
VVGYTNSTAAIKEAEMGTSELRHPSAGTILGSIGALLGLAALIVSLSSGADAKTRHVLVHRGDIAPGAVTAKSLARGAVHAKALAKNAVHTKALAKEAVRARALAKGAVGASAIAPNAVTAAAIAPHSVDGGALGEETFHTKVIADADAVASNPEWTAGNTEIAACAPGEALLSASFSFTEPGNREVAFLQARPIITSTGSSGVAGRITSNSGGTAIGEVGALCLK